MFIRPLNIRCIVDGEGGEAGGEIVETPVDTAPATQEQPSGGNPAWDKIRSELDPISFSRIEPQLKEWDSGVQSRIEKANSQFTPYKDILEGRDPALVQRAIAFADQLDQPGGAESVYEKLGEFLRLNGRMPNAAESEQIAEQVENEAEQAAEDPRIAQLQAQQEQMLQYVQQQQAAEMARQADTELGTALDTFKAAHPELAPEDVQEILSRAVVAAQSDPSQNIDFTKSLDAGFEQFSALKNRILSTPRPGDSAPALPPIHGGSPSAAGQQAKSWGEVPSGDLQDFIANGLRQAQGR